MDYTQIHRGNCGVHNTVRELVMRIGNNRVQIKGRKFETINNFQYQKQQESLHSPKFGVTQHSLLARPHGLNLGQK